MTQAQIEQAKLTANFLNALAVPPAACASPIAGSQKPLDRILFVPLMFCLAGRL